MHKEKVVVGKYIFTFFHHFSFYPLRCRRPRRKKIDFFVPNNYYYYFSERLRSVVFDREILWRRRLFVHRRLVWRADRTAGPAYRISRRLPSVPGVCAAGINQAYRTCCAHGFATTRGDRTSSSSRRAPLPITAFV